MLRVTFYDDLSDLTPMLKVANHSGLSFSTTIPGGYAECSFSMPITAWFSQYWYGLLENRPIRIADDRGRIVYEGYVTTVTSENNQFNVTATGWYSKAGNITFGMLDYPEDPARTTYAIIKDCVDIMGSFWNDRVCLGGSNFPLMKKITFEPEQKVNEVLEKMLAYGAGGDELLFAIYDGRTPILSTKYIYPKGSWFATFKRNANLQFGSTISLDSVYNKIQVKYTDASGADRLLDWKTDDTSIRLFGERQGTLNAGSFSVSGAAGDLTALNDAARTICGTAQDLALKYLAYPVEEGNLTITGKVGYAGCQTLYDDPYMIRAGTYIFIKDIPGNYLGVNRISNGIVTYEQSLCLFVNGTTYNADDNSIEVSVGRSRASLDFWLSNLGIESGSVS